MFKYIVFISIFFISLCSYAKPLKLNLFPSGLDGRYKSWTAIVADEPDKFFRQAAFVFKYDDSPNLNLSNYGMYILECGHSSYQYFDMPNPDINPIWAYSMPIDEDKVADYLYKELCPSLLLENVMKRFR